MVDVIIIGGGIAGAAMGRVLSRYDLKVVLLEKANDVADGTTMANSAIIHAGYDAPYGSLKSHFNVLGNPMFDVLCQELDVPFKRIGSLVLAFSGEELLRLTALRDNGQAAGVEGLEILDQETTRSMEPNISDTVVGALYAKTAAIVSPFELAIAMVENAINNGMDLRLNEEVLTIETSTSGFIVTTSQGQYETRSMINCAGVHSDLIDAMVGLKDYQIIPRKGQYYVLDKGTDVMFNHILFQCPTKEGKGVLITPTVHGNVLVGPDASVASTREDKDTEADQLAWIKKIALKTCTSLPFDQVIRTFAGIRATSTTHDFLIGKTQVAGYFRIAGFESPGLSSIPAVADQVADEVRTFLGHVSLKEGWIKGRRPVLRFESMSPQEREAITRGKPSYGKIICRCELISEGEITDAIHRPCGARTLKGVKKRTRPGMGRCQGGFCGPRVMEILSRELACPMEELVYDDLKGYMVTGETKGGDKGETL